jgi:hypothetical protein
MEYCMKTVDSQTAMAHPKPFASFLSGFDSITTHIWLIIFPVVLDLIIWLGPHFRIRSLIEAINAQITSASGLSFSPSTESAQMSKEFWSFIAEHFNLLTLIRSIPVGIPSLMAGSSPVQIPSGEPAFMDISSGRSALAIWILMSLVGLFLGTFYYIVVSQVSLNGSVNWRKAFGQWPGASVQVIALAVFWVFLFLLITLPASCIISFLLSVGMPLGQVTFILLFGFLLWIFFPLLFSAHGIVVYRLNMLASVRHSVMVTRLNLPATSLFFLTLLLISQLLDIIWRWPAEDSWFALVGILGHAFITTGLLAASFIFYRDANQWLQKSIGQTA